MISDVLAWLIGGELGAQGHVEWTAPGGVIAAAALACTVSWVASLPGSRPAVARVGEAALWGLTGLALTVAIAQPVWVEEQGRTEPARLAVLVDGSRSMGILEDGAARSVAAEAVLDSLAGPDTDFYTFGNDLAIGRPGAYDLDGTDLEGALVALSERMAGDKLAGIVVISDGLDRGLLRARFVKDEKPAPPPSLPGPLTVVQVGSPLDLHDLAVRSVDTGGFAFVRGTFPIAAELSGIGYAGRTVRAQLLQDGAPVALSDVTLDKDGKGTARFEVRPDEAGRFTYAVQVPVYEDDAVPANNTMPAVVRVVRDRIRVLQVAGAPSWDVKFLRRFLKGDPSVDLVSFFILRTSRDTQAGYAERELSLIPFPHDKLFDDELGTFDLVVFQNFDHRPYFEKGMRSSADLLGNVKDFVVRDGHAFAMIGGDRSFDLGEYDGTPIEDILPVKLGVPGHVPDWQCTTLCDATPFLPALTDEGRRHPITRLAPDPQENELWWSRLHTADGANRVLGPADGAAVLLQHPSLTTPSGEPMPVLAVREVGAGRTLALTIDASWRWSFSEAAEGRGNQAYLRFWKNAFHWMMKDPTAARVVVETPRENYALGDTVRVVVRARDPGYAPLPGATVEAVVSGAGGSTTLAGVTGSDGEVALEWPADRRGALRVTAKVSTTAGPVGESDTVFAVTTRDPELDEAIPDEAFLRWVAAASNGVYVGPGEAVHPRLDATAGRTVWDRRETAIWRAPLLAIVASLAAGLAFVIRRRAGLR